MRTIIDDMNDAVNMSRWNAKLSMSRMRELKSYIQSIEQFEYWNKCAITVNSTINNICSQSYCKGEYLAEYWDYKKDVRLTEIPIDRLTIDSWISV